MAIANKTVLITGASSGLGRAMALELARHNNNLVVTARRAALLETLAAEIEHAGSQCLVVACDATDTDESNRLVRRAVERFGGVDIAVLNAGGTGIQRMGEVDARGVAQTMRANYDTLVNFLVPLIEVMRDRGGTIAYTGSPAGYFGLPKSGPYSAAKAAGRVLLDACRIELAHTPIRFVALYPGFTYTEGLVESEVPIKALIISKERAAREMLGAIERRRAHWIFPRRIRWLIALARMLPEPVRRRILGAAGG